MLRVGKFNARFYRGSALRAKSASNGKVNQSDRNLKPDLEGQSAAGKLKPALADCFRSLRKSALSRIGPFDQ
ncbi:hypothetical protein AYM39_12750 [Methylomonas sp. DH-1]|nr:hypothetical protein AYM39_12750 [Methylomonas sp. DH-1]